MAVNRGKYEILVVEDNPGDFALVEDFLFEQIDAPAITHVTNFSATYNILSDKNCRFDIILLDLTLPDKTGEAVIHAIIELCQNIPVIVLTGYADFAFGVKSLSMGISDYLLKDDLTATSLYKSIIYSIERKKSIADLEESEKRYSEVFHFSPQPMWVVDTETLQFLDVNKATLDHYGYTRDEFLGMSLRDIRPVSDIPALEKVFETARHHPEEIGHRSTIHKKKNGELRNVEVQYAQITYKGIKSNIVIAIDVTERLNYIKAIEDRNDQLQEISWIQSHIVRAPLSRIMGLIPLIENAEEGDHEISLMMSYLASSANELDEVIKKITDKTIIKDYHHKG